MKCATDGTLKKLTSGDSGVSGAAVQFPVSDAILNALQDIAKEIDITLTPGGVQVDILDTYADDPAFVKEAMPLLNLILSKKGAGGKIIITKG